MRDGKGGRGGREGEDIGRGLEKGREDSLDCSTRPSLPHPIFFATAMRPLLSRMFPTQPRRVCVAGGEQPHWLELLSDEGGAGSRPSPSLCMLLLLGERDSSSARVLKPSMPQKPF